MSGKGINKIECPGAPAPVGPYSQAVSAGGFVFVSGQIPIDPETGEIRAGGIREQASLAIKNAEAILSSCGLGLDKVVKVDVYLKDIGDFPAMNEVYSSAFNGSVKPARCVIQASRLPKDVLIELSCVAFSG
jgi:2-iminobutanoate/2-iminopropanoate deaminase